jgi:hypothetical protein
MTFEEVLCALQKRLLEAMKQNDSESAYELFTTFSLLRELSYDSDNRALTGVLVGLTDAAREIAMNGRPKDLIPSVDDIHSVFASTTSGL